MDELEPARQEAIRVLSTAVATDRLPVDQFESRLGLIRQAPNRATLDAIVADVLPTGPVLIPHLPVRIAADHTDVVPVEPAEYLRVATVFGSTKRAGSWTVPLHLDTKVTFGELVLDMRDAVFGSDVFDLEVNGWFSNIVLIVPAGTQVENEVEERFSASTHSTRSAKGATPNGLLVRITGRIRFSNLEIKEKRPSGEATEKPGWMKLLGAGD